MALMQATVYQYRILHLWAPLQITYILPPKMGLPGPGGLSVLLTNYYTKLRQYLMMSEPVTGGTTRVEYCRVEYIEVVHMYVEGSTFMHVPEPQLVITLSW